MTTALLAAACHSGSALHRPANAMPIAASDAHGPGTKLREGWVVPRGAVVAGSALPTVFPSRPGVSDVNIGQWHATLAIDGPLTTVMHSLRDQADELHWHGGQSCVPDAHGADQFVGCGANFDNGRHSVNVFVAVDDQRSLLLMNFWDSVPGPSCPTASPCSDVVPTPHVTPHFTPLPGDGEALFTSRVVAGSHVVATWKPDAFKALIRVDSQPDHVVDGYVRQLRAAAEGGPLYSRLTTIERWRVHVWSAYIGEELESVTEYASGAVTYVELNSDG